MSTRMRIVRTATAVLTILALGSIGFAGVLGVSSVGPDTAFATAQEVQAGTLGVGQRTIAPLTEPISVSEKVDVEPSTSAALATIAAPAGKRVSSRAQWLKATGPAKPRIRAAALPARSTSGWLQARCSWYGPGFYGRTMAGGGKLTPSSMVVAHKRLPFGTRIQFWHRGKTVVAVVQDRGPYVSGRTFDLGPGTAKALGFSGVGILRYKILRKA